MVNQNVSGFAVQLVCRWQTYELLLMDSQTFSNYRTPISPNVMFDMFSPKQETDKVIWLPQWYYLNDWSMTECILFLLFVYIAFDFIFLMTQMKNVYCTFISVDPCLNSFGNLQISWCGQTYIIFVIMAGSMWC